MIYQELIHQFEQQANSERAIQMSKYMRHQFKFYGIQTPIRKKIYQSDLKEAKKNKIIDWQLLQTAFENPHRECQYFVIDYLARLQAYLKYEDIDSYLFYFVKHKQWWDTIDGFDRVIGNIGLKDSRVDQLMLSWSLADDIWLRRIAIDHQLLRKERTNTDLLSQIIINNLNQTEFFINKAIGWSLREYSKTDKAWVRNFIIQNTLGLSKLSIREASKYL
ncbi:MULTISPECIES: DNA alkylation repair protein [unclassified Enterococcus]|uniref:DNA alkylation repair protein n=1 Tax=unclassified Enterococcus TaxID=2608891 RepID=UPI001557030D|nr:MULTISPECIES: DNA alkylation repair protein [unclassified Enterococcus]MBS7578067.1 DNA alkylation repair protein [Enterococcus sp. MMGLQ5-2]MBS7585327.1 DNA alkylation repair protein [Enterococcus sp. MMGLQ5-1]NPD13184.1 DNA alkylation repair protein [Enterococcus sp. MMGLQ5-1]NPD37898.1 DNA alkylation repair protein [Enterococcus sp. MMGLQ5-2]